MRPTKFELTSPVLNGKVTFEYDANNGWLKGLQIEGEITEQQHEAILARIPFKNEDKEFKACIHGTSASICSVEEDLSFERFWKLYNHKIGNKKRAESLWVKLPQIQKVNAIKYIKTYDNMLKLQNGIAKLYPETYLHQTRWNN